MKAHDVKRLVAYYVKKYNTRNPFELASYLGVEVQTGQLGESSGFYMFLKNHKCVFLNEDLEEHERTLVMAHELAHSIMHRKENCYFIRNRTLMLTSKIEIEANTFAAELLIPDEIKAFNFFFSSYDFRNWGFLRDSLRTFVCFFVRINR